MAVQYVRVNPVVDLFAPVIRGTGNLAIVGPVTPPIANSFRSWFPTVVATPGAGGGFPVAGSYGVAYSEVTADGVPRRFRLPLTSPLPPDSPSRSMDRSRPRFSRNFYVTAAPAGVNTGLAAPRGPRRRSSPRRRPAARPAGAESAGVTVIGDR